MPKEKKIWLFFELDKRTHTSVLRAVALDKDARDRFEISLNDEARIRKEQYGQEIEWAVEESLANHLYGGDMYKPPHLAWKKYRVKGRAIDGD